jgi:hypothetical protein
VTAGERDLRAYFASHAGGDLVACAYGIERESRAQGLARLLGASAWIGGAFEADAGWGLATTAERLLVVRVRRVRRLLRGPKLVLGRLQSYASSSELGASVEPGELEVVFRLVLEGRPSVISFTHVAGFPDNLRQARSIAGWLVDHGW